MSPSTGSGHASTGSGHVLSDQAFERAKRLTPGGVNSPVRAFLSVGGTPRFIARAAGPFLYDLDGNELVDLICSWGPMLLGHAHPEVIDAVTEAAGRGTSYGAPTVAEVDLAAAIVDRTPVEQVRLVSSGTEATMSVLRLARGITGRDKIVKFAGCYHGHVDALLAAAGSGVATLANRPGSGVSAGSIPSSPGVTEATTADTIVVQYNDRAGVRAAFADVRRPDRLRDHRGRRRKHGRHPAGGRGRRRLQQLPGRHRPRARCAVHLRRGDDRIPGQPVRPVRPGRGRAGSDDLRQGDGRWLSGGGVRRSGRADAAAWRRSAGSTRPARCRGTRSPPRPDWPPCDWPRRRSTSTSTGSPVSCGTRSPPRCRPPASPMSSSAPGTCSACSS